MERLSTDVTALADESAAAVAAEVTVTGHEAAVDAIAATTVVSSASNVLADALKAVRAVIGNQLPGSVVDKICADANAAVMAQLAATA